MGRSEVLNSHNSYWLLLWLVLCLSSGVCVSGHTSFYMNQVQSQAAELVCVCVSIRNQDNRSSDVTLKCFHQLCHRCPKTVSHCQTRPINQPNSTGTYRRQKGREFAKHSKTLQSAFHWQRTYCPVSSVTRLSVEMLHFICGLSFIGWNTFPFLIE